MIEQPVARQHTLLPPHQSLSISADAAGKQNHRTLFWEVSLLGAVLLLALLLRLWHLSALTDNYDEGVYWSSLRAMRAGNGLFTPVFSSQPPLFLPSLYPLVALLGPTQVAARLGIVCFSLIGILAMYLLARRLAGPWAGVSAALLLACDYLYLIQSQTIDAEVPAVALTIAALAAAAYANRYPWQAALISGVATALALLEKLFAVAAIAPLLLLFVGHLIAFERAQPAAKQPEQNTGLPVRLRLFHRQTLLRVALLVDVYLAGLELTGLLVLLPYLGQLQTLYQQVIAFHLAADQSYDYTLSRNPGILLDTKTAYPLAALALLGFVLGLLRRRWHVLTAAAWVLASLVLLLRQAPLFPHHLVLLSPGLVLCAAVGLAPRPETFSSEAAALHARLQRFRPGWSIGASKTLLIGTLGLLAAATLLLNLRDAALYPLGPVTSAARISQVASDLQRLTTPQQQVITDDQYIAALANRDVPPALVDTSDVRIITGYLTTDQVIAIAEQHQVGAILFYTGRFDKLPGFRDWVKRHFLLARAYGKGRDLYLRASPRRCKAANLLAGRIPEASRRNCYRGPL